MQCPKVVLAPSQSTCALPWSFWSTQTVSSPSGDEQQGSEKLWGAVSQATMAVGAQRGWRSGKSAHRREIARNLAVQYGDPLIARDYSIAEKFHANFYHDFMETEQIEQDRPMIHELVQRLKELVEEYTEDPES